MPQRVYRIGDITSTKDATVPERIGSDGRIRKGGFKPGRRGLLPVSPATWWRWVASGEAPAPFKLGLNTTVWDAEKVEQFVARRAGGQQG